MTFTDARLYCGWIEPDAVRVFTTQLNAANFAHSSDVAIPAYPNVGAEGILFFAVRDEWGAPPGGVALDGVGQGTNIYTRQDNIIDDSISGEYAIYLFNAAQAVASYGDGDRVLSVLGYPADIEGNPTGADPEPEEPPEDTTLTDTDVRYIGWVGDFVLTVTAVEWAAAVRYENGGPLTIPPFPAHLHLHGTPWIAVPRALGDPNPVLRSQNGNPGLSPTFRQMRDERTVGGVIFDLWTADNQYDAHFGDGTWTFTAAV